MHLLVQNGSQMFLVSRRMAFFSDIWSPAGYPARHIGYYGRKPDYRKGRMIRPDIRCIPITYTYYSKYYRKKERKKRLMSVLMMCDQ